MIVVAETDNYIVIHKPSGVATQTARLGEKDLVSEVKNYRAGKGEKTYAAVINRLDQPVEGLVLIAKDDTSAAKLTAQLNEGKIEKYYVAQVYGIPKKERQLTDYLIKDAKTNLSRVVSKETKGSKKAALEYKVIEEQGEMATVIVHLITGRHHQIRVQMAHMGYPLLGDRKYGNEQSLRYSVENNIKAIRLKAYRLGFCDPSNGRPVEYKIDENF